MRAFQMFFLWVMTVFFYFTYTSNFNNNNDLYSDLANGCLRQRVRKYQKFVCGGLIFRYTQNT